MANGQSLRMGLAFSIGTGLGLLAGIAICGGDKGDGAVVRAVSPSAVLSRARQQIVVLNPAIDDSHKPGARRALHLAGDLLRELERRDRVKEPIVPSPSEKDPLVEIHGKIAIACADIPERDAAAVLVTAGQSNATNEPGEPQTGGEGVYNFDLVDGKCYRAKDPLLGTTGVGGNFATRLGSLLVASGHYPSVIIAPVAIGGTYVHDWTPQGRLYGRLVTVLTRLRVAGFEPTHILWHQGEGDAGIKTSKLAYSERLLSIVASLQDFSVDAPFYVARATICHGGANLAIRAAQADVVDSDTVFAGPDTDSIGLEFRYDGCHFNSAGNALHADLWFEALTR